VGKRLGEKRGKSRGSSPDHRCQMDYRKEREQDQGRAKCEPMNFDLVGAPEIGSVIPLTQLRSSNWGSSGKGNGKRGKGRALFNFHFINYEGNARKREGSLSPKGPIGFREEFEDIWGKNEGPSNFPNYRTRALCKSRSRRERKGEVKKEGSALNLNLGPKRKIDETYLSTGVDGKRNRAAKENRGLRKAYLTRTSYGVRVT